MITIKISKQDLHVVLQTKSGKITALKKLISKKDFHILEKHEFLMALPKGARLKKFKNPCFNSVKFAYLGFALTAF